MDINTNNSKIDKGHGKKSLQEWWRLLLKFMKDRGKKITAGVMEITIKIHEGQREKKSLMEITRKQGLVFYAQSTSVVISGWSEEANNHSMDITCKEGKKKSLQEWWISLVKFTKDLTGTVVAANLCLWELLQVNQPALHGIHSQGSVRLVLFQLCTKTPHAAIIHWTHFIIVLISRLASLTCWPQLSRPPCLFATLDEASLPLRHSWWGLPASLPLLMRPPCLFATPAIHTSTHTSAHTFFHCAACFSFSSFYNQSNKLTADSVSGICSSYPVK